MHIAFFSDQHPATIGGLQVSLGLQRDRLEALGHTVTVCAPASTRTPSARYARRGDVLLPSRQIGNHSFAPAGTRADRSTDAGFSHRPPVDVVHVQADVWGAWNGYRFARRHGLPVVHTMHTDVEVGLPAVVPFPRTMFRLLFASQQHHLQGGPVHDMAGYVRAFADAADAVIVPSAHFARRLRRYGVDRLLHIIPTGVDDHRIEMLAARPRRHHDRPVLVWPGRVSAEKRLDDVLHAFARVDPDAELHVYGSGSELRPCRLLGERLGIADRLRFHGVVPHDDVLEAIRQADGVIQSSLGYETQGLTVYEAVALGTPVLVRDREIAAELPGGSYDAIVDASIDALADGLRRMVARSRRRARVGRDPRPRGYSQCLLTDRIPAIYRQVAGVAADHRPQCVLTGGLHVR